MGKFPILSLHQLDEEGKEHELYVNTFSEHIARHHAHVLVPHRHDFYVTVVFTEGSGFHEIDFQRYSIEPGAVFFMQPGQIHHWEFSPETEGYVLLHSRSFFELNIRSMSLDKLPFFSSKLNSPKLQISDKDKGNNAILPDLMGEFEGRKLFKYSRMAMLVCELYINLARLYAEERPHLVQQNPLYSGKFRELEKTIDVHFVQEKGVEFYAEKLNMSSRHLNRICRQVAGKTFSRIITERIMLEARHLLSSTDLSFNEIARQLGYEEYSYFSKLFKQYCGVNLRDFKVRYM